MGEFNEQERRAAEGEWREMGPEEVLVVGDQMNGSMYPDPAGWINVSEWAGKPVSYWVARGASVNIPWHFRTRRPLPSGAPAQKPSEKVTHSVCGKDHDPGTLCPGEARPSEGTRRFTYTYYNPGPAPARPALTLEQMHAEEARIASLTVGPPLGGGVERLPSRCPGCGGTHSGLWNPGVCRRRELPDQGKGRR